MVPWFSSLPIANWLGITPCERWCRLQNPSSSSSYSSRHSTHWLSTQDPQTAAKNLYRLFEKTRLSLSSSNGRLEDRQKVHSLAARINFNSTPVILDPRRSTFNPHRKVDPNPFASASGFHFEYQTSAKYFTFSSRELTCLDDKYVNILCTKYHIGKYLKTLFFSAISWISIKRNWVSGYSSYLIELCALIGDVSSLYVVVDWGELVKKRFHNSIGKNDEFPLMSLHDCDWGWVSCFKTYAIIHQYINFSYG